MRLVRMYTGPDGQSHFEDMEFPAGQGFNGEQSPLLRAAGPVTWRHVAPGPPAGWHTAPRRQYVVVLSGQMEVEVAGGETRRFGPGDLLLTEDLSGKGHITRTVGDQPRVLLNIPLEW
jgi:quercetin dioxygenase-like cupin family protein